MQRFLLSLLLLWTVSISFSQLPKGDRILAYQVDMSENENYDSAFYYASSACAESIHLFHTWNSIEKDAGEFDPEGLLLLDVTNIYFPLNGMEVEMQLAPINTVAKTVPEDLAGVDFSDPVLIDRFKAFIDTFFVHCPDVKLSALNIGNEHDVYFADDPLAYSNYSTFLDSIVPYTKAKYFALHGEELKMGTTFTFHGLTDPSSTALCQTVNENLDIVTTTYYPLEPDFTMQDPAVVFDDFDELVDLYSDPDQPIYFAECGYSSSEVCNSSELQQAQFFSNIFEAWDEHSEQIKYLTIFKTTDWSQEAVDTFAVYYGIESEEFKEYLRALGVRTYPGDGTDKIAYNWIKCLLEERSWCTPLSCIGAGQEEVAVIPEIRIYPSPANNFLSVSWQNTPSAHPDQSCEITIRDMSGKVLLSKEIQASEEIQLDISDLKSGAYLIQLTQTNSLFQSRFIKG